MATAAKVTKKAADQLEQEAVGDAELALVDAADDMQPVSPTTVAGSARDPDADKPLMPFLESWTPPQVAEGDDELAEWIKVIDESGKNGACVAFHVGLRLLAEQKAAVAAANGRKRGVQGIWLASRVESLRKDDRTLRLYMQIAGSVTDKSATPLPLSILKRPLRDVPKAILKFRQGKDPDDKSAKAEPDSEGTKWVRDAARLVERARKADVPIEEVKKLVTAITQVETERDYLHASVTEVPEYVPSPDAKVESCTGLITYAGGKSDHSGVIVGLLRELAGPPGLKPMQTYCEPFVGGGSVLRTVARTCSDLFGHVTINDKNPATVAMYNVLFRKPTALRDRIKQLQLTEIEWFRCSAVLRGVSMPEDDVDLAMALIVTQQTGNKGQGAMAGSPPSKFREKWNADAVWAKLDAAFSEIRPYLWEDLKLNTPCSSLDACDLISRLSERHVVYLDPPYAGAGPVLYAQHFTPEDHRRLRNALANTRARWLLSYDDHPLPKLLYQDENIQRISHPLKKGETELLIWPKRFGG
jgi:DNA adenine methylase